MPLFRVVDGDEVFYIQPSMIADYMEGDVDVYAVSSQDATEASVSKMRGAKGLTTQSVSQEPVLITKKILDKNLDRWISDMEVKSVVQER